ncbi:snapalysin family zinc-dependent metalloprotease [Amycolatopsis minnesotensis]|uniref:Extracellular small neutral protease n=1 Tax=Amycolatopsis minnesotensis TaxID=337894 RepID=A0ABN2RQS4_9PSEU
MSLRKFVSTVGVLSAIALPTVFVGAGAAEAAPAINATTITYNLTGAPNYASAIRTGVSRWGTLRNVKFQETTGRANLTYRQGNYSGGSYYTGNGHGTGNIYLDIRQMGQYDHVRVAAHETGHDLGLPDHYSGPCSELMSGGGPGPSCTNSYPNANEVARADANFRFAATEAELNRTVVVRGY